MHENKCWKLIRWTILVALKWDMADLRNDNMGLLRPQRHSAEWQHPKSFCAEIQLLFWTWQLESVWSESIHRFLFLSLPFWLSLSLSHPVSSKHTFDSVTERKHTRRCSESHISFSVVMFWEISPKSEPCTIFKTFQKVQAAWKA